MTAEQLLENYIMRHPEYWDFENERNEVRRLRRLCENEVKQNILLLQNNFQFQLYA